MSQQGLFITVEGTEGVGKSTNMAFIAQLLSDAGIELVQTREPGGTPFAEEIRAILLQSREEEVSPLAELLLVFAARSQHLAGLIQPQLERGCWVLCDRFTDATFAYQGGGRGLSMGAISMLQELVQGELRPHCTILLDAPVDIGMKRAGRRGDLDRFESEKLEFYERVRNTYLELARGDAERYRVIDASRPLSEVQEQIRQAVQHLLADYGGAP